MLEKFNFREQDITYNWKWSDSDTFVFQFGDGEFTDLEEEDYFLHFEYHVVDDD